MEVESLVLDVPDLQHVATVLDAGLKQHFKNSSVRVVDCPDLTAEPFCLAAPGLCGNPRIVDVGGVKNLTPLPNKTVFYDFGSIAQLMPEVNSPLMIGAGAGPHDYVGVNCEMVSNLKLGDDGLSNQSRVSYVGEQGNVVVKELPDSQARCALMMNLLVSEGKPGKVLEVVAETRISEMNFVTALRQILAAEFGSQPVAVGGVFLLESGTAWCHVMPGFSDTPLCSDAEVDEWLRYYEMHAPLLFCSVFVSHDPGLDLRMEHSHGFGPDGLGHYHYDTTPESVKYRGYFTVGEQIVRADKP
ncbi:unnamed protein product [Notodromas monacha]|uniref:DUF1907 domain-containing protein n=1 Tax=Notodromas monacha TaxID=399045 RepID=A0A7R9BP90_9CRUS|nr:unnamed protein product [Notodromas monacha]CAG0918281.1 unnamed protein product [Notodromas monacha]